MKTIAMLVILMISGAAGAEPEPLVVDKKIHGRANVGAIKKVHLEIPTNGASVAKTRFLIVEGMLRTKNRAWTYEGEGDGYILARFDYRGHIIVMRVEYNENLIQLKYHGGSEAYQCDILVGDGICYENHQNYFKYTKNLRSSIEHKVRVL
jgi:hypothetical protein